MMPRAAEKPVSPAHMRHTGLATQRGGQDR
jgi:hypothetical protein